MKLIKSIVQYILSFLPGRHKTNPSKDKNKTVSHGDETNLDQQKQNTQTIAILRSVSAADPENRRFGNALRIQLASSAREQHKRVVTKLIDFDQIFRDAIDKAYKLKERNSADPLNTLKARLRETIAKSMDNNASLKEEFLKHYYNPQRASDYNEVKNTIPDYLDLIYQKEIIPALRTLDATMEKFAGYSDKVKGSKESQWFDYKDPQQRKMLLQQEEKAMLGSMLMGKWAAPELCGEIYDQEKYLRVKDFIRGNLNGMLKDVDRVYTQGYSYNPAPPGRPINGSRAMVENSLLSICMKENNTPILSVCGGMQNFWLKQGAKLQRIGNVHSGDIHKEDKILYLQKENLLYNPNHWGKDAFDKVLKHVQNTGFSVDNGKVKINCDHSQAVLYTPELQERIFKLDPKAITIVSHIECNPKTKENIEARSVRISPNKKRNRGLEVEPAVTGKATIVEAVIMPTRGIITMQSHPDGFKKITTKHGKVITDDQIHEQGINTDGEDIAYKASVQSNSNSRILANIIARGKKGFHRDREGYTSFL